MLSDIVNRESAIPLDSPDVPTLDQQFHATIAEASDNGVYRFKTRRMLVDLGIDVAGYAAG